MCFYIFTQNNTEYWQPLVSNHHPVHQPEVGISNLLQEGFYFFLYELQTKHSDVLLNKSNPVWFAIFWVKQVLQTVGGGKSSCLDFNLLAHNPTMAPFLSGGGRIQEQTKSTFLNFTIVFLFYL